MRIGELAEAAGTTTKTLRFYEERGLLPPAERTPAAFAAALADLGVRPWQREIVAPMLADVFATHPDA